MSHRIELELRLADAADVIEALELDDDGNMKDPEQFGPFLSALEHALQGDAGCVEPKEFQARRMQAHEKHATTLGL